jgi:hypothetical protein
MVWGYNWQDAYRDKKPKYTYPGWGGTQPVPTAPGPGSTNPGWTGPGWAPTPAPAPAAPAAPAGPTPEEQAAAQQRTHYMEAFRAIFSKLGMSLDPELETILKGAIDNGYTDVDLPIIMPDIINTQAFKTRFVGYEAYKANHNGVAIDLGEYIRLEWAYRDILQQAGLPAGFYDDYSDFGNLIAHNVSPDELAWRASTAVNLAKEVDPTMRNLLSTFYGVSTGDIAAYFLDPTRAQNLIEHQYKSADVASWAMRNGYAVDNMKRFEQLVDDGVTAEQAAQGYATVRALDDALGSAASVYGESYGQADAERDVFFNDNEKRRRIMAMEAGTFSGTTSGQQGTVRRSDY